MLDRRNMLARLGAVWIGLGLGLGACTDDVVSSATSTNPDATAARVVVLDPGIAEVFIHLGAVDRLVGRPDYTDHLTPLASLPTMGTALSPNYEQIVRAAPDLILAGASRGTVVRDLENIAPTRGVPWLTVAEVTTGVRAIGEMIGHQVTADALASELNAELIATTSPESPRVLLLLGPPSEAAAEIWYAKPHSLHGAALAAAGGINAITEALAGPPSISVEALMQLDPDIIVIMVPDRDTPEDARDQHLAFWTRFPMLQAVKNNRIGFMANQTHFSTGPGIIDFKRALARTLTELRGRDG